MKAAWLIETTNNENYVRYLASGLRTEVELKRTIDENIRNRGGERLLIEVRMLESIQSHLLAAGLDADTVSKSKAMPDLASMANEIGHDRLFYLVGQKIGSHHVHGTWSSLLLHYISDREAKSVFKFGPRGHDCDTHMNQFIHIPLIVLSSAEKYVDAVLDADHSEIFLGLLGSTRDRIHELAALAWAAQDARSAAQFKSHFYLRHPEIPRELLPQLRL